ncbi:MAG: hypothetical protein ACHQFZ_09295 [Acidimicrobiales bacterium]
MSDSTAVFHTVAELATLVDVVADVVALVVVVVVVGFGLEELSAKMAPATASTATAPTPTQRLVPRFIAADPAAVLPSVP